MVAVCFLAVLGAASSTCAGIVLPAGGSVLTTGSLNLGGTVLGDITTPFVAPGGFFSGTLRALAVMEAGGTFDFYYQITNTTTDPTEFIDGLVASNFTGFTTEVDWVTNGLTGITGAGTFAVGSTPAESATRDLSPPDDVTFFFPIGSLSSAAGQNPSSFLLIKTNATSFAPGQVVVSGAGFTSPLAAFAPAAVPEPATALFGFGLVVFTLLSPKARSGNRPSGG